MFSLPIPFVESKGSTFDIKMGYTPNPNDCSCVDTTSSGSTDTTAIEDKLDDILAAILTSNANLTDIVNELASQNVDVEQTTIFATGSGTIPAGVQSYTFINLGIDPTDPASLANAMIINGLSINTKVLSYGNSTDTNQVLVDPITYDANGNTLFITYNTPL